MDTQERHPLGTGDNCDVCGGKLESGRGRHNYVAGCVQHLVEVVGQLSHRLSGAEEDLLQAHERIGQLARAGEHLSKAGLEVAQSGAELARRVDALEGAGSPEANATSISGGLMDTRAITPTGAALWRTDGGRLVVPLSDFNRVVTERYNLGYKDGYQAGKSEFHDADKSE